MKEIDGEVDPNEFGLVYVLDYKQRQLPEPERQQVDGVFDVPLQFIEARDEAPTNLRTSNRAILAFHSVETINDGLIHVAVSFTWDELESFAAQYAVELQEEGWVVTGTLARGQA